MRLFLIAMSLGLMVILGSWGCSDSGGEVAKTDASPAIDAQVAVDSLLGQPPQLSSELTSNCYNWPAEDFDPTKFAPWKPSVSAGQLAIDFTLRDVDGKAYTLSELLIEKPVWIQLGAFT